MAYFPNQVQYGDNYSVNSKSRLRVSNATRKFSADFRYSMNTLGWNTVTVGVGSSATHLPNESAIQMTCGGNVGDMCTRQSKMYWGESGARACQHFFPVTFGARVSNVRKRVGLFDDFNGFYLQSGSDGVMSFVRRTYVGGSTSEPDVIAQTSWNYDKMDGTGPSGVTLDFTKIQTVCLDFHHPVSRVRLGFRVGGTVRYCHIISCANNQTTTLISNGRLPHRYEIASVAASAGATMKQFSSSFYADSEDYVDVRYFATGSSVTTGISCAKGVRVPIVSIRPKTLFNGISNRGNIQISEIFVYVDTKPVRYELIYSGTLTGPSWKNVDPSEHSITEMDTSATICSGGIYIEKGFVPASNQVRTAIETNIIDRNPICLTDMSGTQGINVTLCATSLDGTAVVYGGICWVEER